MFTAITNATETYVGNSRTFSAIADVTISKGQWIPKIDECESFWMSETLKYFYLTFSEPSLVNLDEYVL